MEAHWSAPGLRPDSVAFRQLHFRSATHRWQQRINDRQLYELKIFHDVAKALTSTLDLDTILQTIMEKMAAYFEPATWSLVMIDESSQEPYYAASVGKGAEVLAALRLSAARL